MMAFPGGAGYGAASDRDGTAIRRDLALGYITETMARKVYGLTDAEIAAVMVAARKGETA
jgi:N-methylhydantoinase B